ncbi:hypothetical protein E4U53_007188 [Claviceps sorghi]|nr:hypothetical protein E4U53_007188 [Claviceps sorghi]
MPWSLPEQIRLGIELENSRPGRSRDEASRTGARWDQQDDAMFDDGWAPWLVAWTADGMADTSLFNHGGSRLSALQATSHAQQAVTH